MNIDIVKALQLIFTYICFLFVFGLSFICFLFVFGLSFCFFFCCYLTLFEHEQFEYEKMFLLFVAFIFSFVVFYCNEKDKNNKNVYNVQKEIILHIDIENEDGTYSENFIIKEDKK